MLKEENKTINNNNYNIKYYNSDLKDKKYKVVIL